jgi:hypothetical protein
MHCVQRTGKYRSHLPRTDCGHDFRTAAVLQHDDRGGTKVNAAQRRLYQIDQLPDLLQLDEEKIYWLVKTGQLRTIRICGELRFDSNEISQLIETYHQIATRKLDHVQ